MFFSSLRLDMMYTVSETRFIISLSGCKNPINQLVSWDVISFFFKTQVLILSALETKPGRCEREQKPPSDFTSDRMWDLP